MGVKYTKDQQRVIDLRNCNILVSAAAGSGKTAVLSERIVKMVSDPLEGVDIDQLLIVTFTKAAAQEMKERIREKLEDKLEEALEEETVDELKVEHLERQCTLLHNSLITTIDSFCFYIVKNHFNEVELDPALRIADENEEKLMKSQVMEELLEELYEKGEESFQHLVEFLCQGKSDRELEETVMEFYNFSQSHPFPLEWLQDRKHDFDYDSEEAFLNSPLGQYMMDYCKKMLQGAVENLVKLKQICLTPDGPYMYEEALSGDVERLNDLVKKASFSDIKEAFGAFSFGKLSAKKDDSVSEEKKEQIKKQREQLKKVVAAIKEGFFETPLEESLASMKKLSPYMNTLMDLVILFSERLMQVKREKKVMSFSDVEHYALQILVNKDGDKVEPTDVAKEYSSFFKEILIDEYQDSNLVQEYILKAVSGESLNKYNRFMVGDVKQSIYRFRQARPELFMEKYDTYQPEDGTLVRVDLSKNFRSRTEVLQSVNTIFEKLMQRDNGGIAYDAAQALYLGADYPEYPDSRAELLLLEEESSAKQDRIENEAQMIGQRIKELKQGYLVKDKDSGQMRPCDYKDMVILLRSNAGWDENIRDTLENMGIPAIVTSKTGYFETEEIRMMLSFLKVLDNPLQDLPLYGAMKSVFGEFSEEEIARIRKEAEEEEKNDYLWDNLLLFGKKEGALSEKCASFAEKINGYREKSSFLPIRNLLDLICKDYHYIQYVSALPGGSKRKRNVEMLLQMATAYEKTSFQGLYHFVRYVNQLKKYEVDLATEGADENQADAVRIMSIHKSKGLEFPITFVAGLGKSFNRMDLNKRFLLDMDYGVGTDLIEPERRVKSKTLGKRIITQRMKQESQGEELRVLYVALTRAKEKLIMTGSLKDAEAVLESSKNAGGIFSYLDFMSADTYLDFILPVFDREKTYTQVFTVNELSSLSLGEKVREEYRREELQNASQKSGEQLLRKIKERFSYVYPYENLKTLYTKTSVSELKIAAMEEKDEAAFQAFENKEFTPRIPTFIKEKEEAGGTERGNAYHKVMEWMDFSYVYGEMQADSYDIFLQEFSEQMVEDRTNELLYKLVSKHKLSEEYRRIVSMKKLTRFLKSSLAYRMWQADLRGELYREQPFVYGIGADRLNADFPSTEKVLIQGIIDAFFVENGQIIVMDYKTDRISAPKDLISRYETQLQYYEEALRNVMNMEVKEKIMYSFSLEQEVSVE